MKILIAPDKFKDSLSAFEVGVAIKKGILEVNPNAEVIILPLADGGEGSIDILKTTLEFTQVDLTVDDPLGRPISTYYYIKNAQAYIQMANASGLTLLSSEERNPLLTSTRGTGQMIKDALSRNCTDIYLFLGGSATNDLGTGMATALGYSFDFNDHSTRPVIGQNLKHIFRIGTSDVLPAVKETRFYGVCDVTNPLLGASGATHTYARQKGADDDAIAKLEDGARQMAHLFTTDLHIDIEVIPGSGAAGGLGAGILAFLDGELISGSTFMMDALHFNSFLEDADLVITGEGSVDSQTIKGKVIQEVVQRAERTNTPVWIFAGIASITSEEFGVTVVKKLETILSRATDRQDAMINAADHLRGMGAECMRSM